MATLEYRLDEPERDHPVLLTYEDIDEDEISTRFICDYLVTEDRVYERTVTASGDRGFIIFVRLADDEQVWDPDGIPHPTWTGIRLEIRQFSEDAAYYPVLETLHCQTQTELRLYLQGEILYRGGKEWRKTSAEVDENRKVFVLYVEAADD
ncbi:hypothetical protein [Desmospora activa]|uniref:Uncharacterized protein n=1 Tax=Desmospora activa DSM 45169 TaxID=1121389 RepID=A0A2T4Z456_9BACL|nr:hypothetical protein [Desmospora activa]PTM56678.1 hypothetical protein C8J48_3003 [Desmospora activa DSM 45169]